MRLAKRWREVCISSKVRKGQVREKVWKIKLTYKSKLVSRLRVRLKLSMLKRK